MKLNTKEAREFIEKIYSDNKDYYSDARGQGLLKVLNKIHSSHAYVAEIIQNAIDADADKIIFKILGDNKLLIEHNGKEFSKQDVKSICEAGTSKKLATDIGFMGIGFKSVYERFQKVAISSHPWKFYFDCPRKEYGLIEQVNKTLPIWDDTIKSPSPKMTCRFELSKPHSKQEKRIQEILKDDLNYVMGENNDLLVMLACQGIQEIIWDDQEWLLEKERVDINYNNVNTNKIIAINNKNYLEWIHLSKSYHPNEKAKKAFYDHRLNEVYLISENIKRKVEVFTRLNDKGVPIMSKTGKSFAVLPMGVSLPFSLNVQADWLVDATRKNTLENNEWHRQIVLQIPKLMAAFLKWSTKNYATDGDSDIYKCLPNFNSKETIISSWFDNDDFKNKLKNELEDLKILPILTQKGYKYISPRKAKLLQESFDILIDNRYKPWLLLGEQAVFRKFISKRLVSVLKELELKNNMSLEFLVNYWEKQPIRKWFTCLGEDKFEALFQLYEILNKLYTRYKYQELLTDDVPCLLLENGTFDTLKNTYSFPKDWFTFIQENSDLAKELKSNLVDEYNIINEKLLHYYIYNSDKELDDFFNLTNNLSLKEILSLWWQRIPKVPKKNIINLILNLTYKAFSNNRYALINKVLCKDESNIILVAPDKALLSKPYSEDYREKIFNKLPIISNLYMTEDPNNRSKNEWVSFFNNLYPGPKGKFEFNFETEKLEYYEAKEKYVDLGLKQSDFPDHRSTSFKKEWALNESTSTIEINNNEYIFINPNLPKEWPRKDKIDYKEAKVFTRWLADSAEKLIKYDSFLMCYIPFKWSSIKVKKLDGIKPSWIKKLQEQKWLPTKNYQEVLSPNEILIKHDPARPDAPVANISDELGDYLSKTGMKFGSDIPKAPVLERLKKSHLKLSIDELYYNLSEAIKLTKEDEDINEELNNLIKNVILIPGPNNKKYSYYRFISSTNHRLDDFLISYSNISDDNKYYKVLDFINNYIPFPKEIKFEQVLLFLQYIWRKEPDPYEIKEKLKYAYSYINQAILDNKKYKILWFNELKSAKIYTKSGKWFSINSDDIIYFDDFNVNIFEQKLEIIEDSILGAKDEDKLSTVENHNIKKISDDFSLYIIEDNPYSPPREWMENLTKIKNLIEEIFNKQINIPDIKTCEEISIKILKGDDVWYSDKNYKVVLDKGILYVIGKNVNKFARKLTTKLLDIWKLNDVHFAGDFGYLISNLARERILIEQINDIRTEKNLPLLKLNQEGQKKVKEKTKELDKTQKVMDVEDERETNNLSKEKIRTKENNDSSSEDKSINSKKDAGSDLTNKEKPSSSNSKSSYNSDRRTAQLNTLLRQLESKLDMKIISEEYEEYIKNNLKTSQTPSSDKIFREHVIDYEKRQGRFPEEKPFNHPGYDIVSYKDPEKEKVSRYIEVKGKNTKWEGKETISLTKRQFLDALKHHTSDKPGEYWVYIVDKEDNKFNVITLINPAAKVSLFDLRADHWEWLTKLNQ